MNFKACVGDAGADSVGSSGCLKTSQSNDSFTLGQSNDSFSHQMSSLTLNPNEPEIENNVLDQNSALQNNRPRFSLNDLNVSALMSKCLYDRLYLEPLRPILFTLEKFRQIFLKIKHRDHQSGICLDIN